MERIDAKATKEKILKTLEEKGPGLPVQLAKAVGLNTIFTSAFLSELSSEGIIKISDMKVGGSPLYYLESKKAMLENFIQYLNPKENEAVKLLREKGFLVDTEQTPVIRVALRGIKDFAVPINKNGIITWRYYMVNEQESPKIEIKTENVKIEVNNEKNLENKEDEQKEVKKDNEVDRIKLELEEKKKELEKLKQQMQENIKDKPEIKKSSKKIAQKKTIDETFLNKIKEVLNMKGSEILNIEEYDKKYALLRIKQNNNEVLFAAFDKKKVDETDILKISKKAVMLNLPYSIVFKGETPKKIKEMMEAYKKLNNLEKLD